MPWSHTRAFGRAGEGRHLGIHLRTGEVAFGGAQQVARIRNYVVSGTAEFDEAREKKMNRQHSDCILLDVPRAGSEVTSTGRFASLLTLNDMIDSKLITEERYPRPSD